MFIDLFDDNKEDPNDFVSFIVFEPASLRIPDNDLLLIGDQVNDLFSQVMDSTNFSKGIQDQILINRLKRIEMMIELLKSNDGLILTKFLSNIWRRYSFFSNLGELFLTQKDLKRLVPSFEFKNEIILDRFIESDEPETESSNEDEEENKNDNEDDKKNDNKDDEKEKT